MHPLLEPWSHPFMQRALLELVFVGVVGAVLGCWIVLYELAYSAESLAHALFPGLVVALPPASPPGLDALLFGDLLGVTRGDLVAAGSLAAVSLVALAALHRPLLAVGFDRGSAASLGTRPLLVDLGLLAAIAAAIVVGVQGLGNLLVLSALIGPAATARALARRVPTMMLAATGVAAGASVAGTTVVAYLALRPLSAARARRAALRRRRRPGRSRLSPAS